MSGSNQCRTDQGYDALPDFAKQIMPQGCGEDQNHQTGQSETGDKPAPVSLAANRKRDQAKRDHQEQQEYMKRFLSENR